MRYLFFSMLVSAGLYFYLSQALPHAAEQEQAPRAPAQQTEPEAERVVQIHGKWYKYRPDNRYVIDGVPTYHVPKAHEQKTVIAQEEHQPPVSPKDENLAKSQKLMQMVQENPMAVYSPEGMKMLKDGLAAAQKSAAERKKALEELGKD